MYGTHAIWKVATIARSSTDDDFYGTSYFGRLWFNIDKAFLSESVILKGMEIRVGMFSLFLSVLNLIHSVIK